MAKILGLDTGGTFTDAVIMDAAEYSIIKTSKSLTTTQDLSIGIGSAIRLVLGIEAPDYKLSFSSNTNEKIAIEDIELVSLSTTLATNSIVENSGSNVGLVLIGFEKDTLNQCKLGEAIGQNPVLFIKGGHNSDGTLQSPLDTKSLPKEIEKLTSKVSAFAIASHFATRNPEHELKVREYIRKHTNMPVSCSYELSASLGGPKRALTTFLNAKIIGLLKNLINSTLQQMQQIGLNCELMVVKGDGSFVSANFAKEYPIETILSGPAASVSGAAFLANENTAVVCDIGGTTTDIAMLKNGSVKLSSDGAEIGGWNTMVKAVKIWTTGLGGDSEMHVDKDTSITSINLGPRRALPLCLLAEKFPACLDIMEQQLSAPIALRTDGKFVIPLVSGEIPAWLSRSEMIMAERLIKSGISALADIADTQVALGAIKNLLSKGLAQLSCFTPTDASHVVYKFNIYNTKAAILGALLSARQKNSKGNIIAKSAEELSLLCLNYLSSASALKIAGASISEDNATAYTAFKTPAIEAALFNISQKSRLLQHKIKLSVPIIAIGASAVTHYPEIAERLDTSLIIPEFAEVAGAIGAAIGSICQQSSLTITQTQESIFRVHSTNGVKDFKSLNEAVDFGKEEVRNLSERKAIKAGAKRPKTTIFEKIETVEIGNGKSLFIEGTITAKTSENVNNLTTT